MSIKTSCLALLFMYFSHILIAQTDTIYYDNHHVTVENRSLATFYKVAVTRKNVEVHTEYYLSGQKRRLITYRKQFKVPNQEWRGSYRPSEVEEAELEAKLEADTLLVLHGTFMEWFETGEMKAQISYFTGKLHGELNTFYSNQKPKRQDAYHLDTLKNGHCFDSLGTEIAHFPYLIPAEFKGGQVALYRFLGANINYPVTARNKQIEGTVYVNFVIDKTGKIHGINTKSKRNSSVNKELIAEAVRVVKLLPAWKPNIVEGEKVSAHYILPIRFKFE